MPEDRRHGRQQADNRFHTTVMQHGSKFAALFYLLLGLSTLTVLHNLATSLLAGELGAALAALAFLGLLGYILHGRRLYAAVLLFTLPVELLIFYLGLSLAPLLGLPTVYAAIVAVSGLAGGVAAYLFHHVSKTGSGVVIGGAAGTTVYAGIAGLGAVITQAMQTIATLDAGTPTGTGATGGVMSIFQFDQAANPDLVFVSGAAAFTVPFLYWYLQAQEQRHVVWAAYLLPVLLYLAVKAVGAMHITSI